MSNVACSKFLQESGDNQTTNTIARNMRNKANPPINQVMKIYIIIHIIMVVIMLYCSYPTNVKGRFCDCDVTICSARTFPITSARFLTNAQALSRKEMGYITNMGVVRTKVLPRRSLLAYLLRILEVTSCV